MTARAALALVLLSGLPVCAQPTSAPTTFEAASVKPADPKAAQATLRGGPGTADPGRISYANVTLETLLITAYSADCKIQEDCDQIGGPPFLRTSRYDIEAKIPAGTTNDQFRIMLQNLLAERFHLTLHHETRDLPGYELTIKGKSKLVPSPPEELGSGDPAGPLVKYGGPGESYGKLLRPGFLIFPHKGTTANVVNHAIGREQSIADFIKILSQLTTSHIVDKTGLTGKYDFTFDWIPEGVTMIHEADGPDIEPPHGVPTAIEDQLGLKLVKTKVALDMVVVDSADKTPTDN